MIKSDITMYDTSRNNCISDPSRCREYNPWNYDLMSRNTNHNHNHNHKVEDEEIQDLNNSMVNDLVSKVLDDDPTTDPVYNYNLNKYNDLDLLKSQSSNSYYKNTNFDSQYRYQENRDILDVYSNLESLCINDLVSQDSFNVNSNSQFKPSYDSVIPESNEPSKYNLQAHHQTQYQPQTHHQTPWTDFEDPFDGYQQFPCHDLNYNTISPPSTSTLHDHQDLTHPASLINIQDFNNTNQSYHRPSSAMTDFSTDSGFLSNSPLQTQHLSPDFTHFSSYRLDEPINSQNLATSSSLLSNSGFKNFDKLDYDYKTRTDYINYHDNDIKSMAVNQKIDDPLVKIFSTSAIKIKDIQQNHQNHGFNHQNLSNHHNQLPSNHQNQLPNHQNHLNNPGYPYRLPRINGQTTQITMDQLNKYNYPLNIEQNYQRYTANNDLKSTNTLSMINNNSYQNNNGSKPINTVNNHNYDNREAAGSINYSNLAAQLRNVDPNLLHSILKQQQQQQQQSQSMRMPDMLMNARIIRANTSVNASAGAPAAGIYPSMLSVPLVQPINGIINAGIGLRGIKARRAGASSVLHLRLEQTFDQFKQLEKERKKCEAGLAAHFPGKRVTSANNIPVPRLQGNPSRADRLIIDHLREHARVITLIAKMEHLRGVTMNERVHKAMEFWLESIKYVQDCRKKEITHATKRQKENPHCSSIHDDKDIVALAESIKELTRAARLARTAMFNAMQSTLLQNKDFEKKIIETSSDVILTIITKESVASSSASTSASLQIEGTCTSLTT